MAGMFCATIFARADFHVSTKGKDSNAGTERAPFASLERARDAVRELKQRTGLPANGVTVWIHKGDYPLSRSFALTNLDSGEPGRPIIYRAAKKGTVRFIGGRVLPAKAFRAVSSTEIARIDPTARGQVRVADLAALGITELGTFPDRFGGAAPLPELFFNDQRMTLARWPNKDWAEFTKVIESGPAEWRKQASDKFGQFEFVNDRLERWRNAPAVWLNGYWCFDWSSETIRVGEIDPRQHRITLAHKHHYGLGSGNPGPRRFIAINLLEELDQPGEYFIDRAEKKLYFWPPGSIRRNSAILSTLSEPVIAIHDASYIELVGLTVMDCVATGIAMEGGEGNKLIACAVRNTGMDGAVIQGGENHLVTNCEISENGTAGLRLSGGERKTLTPCGHAAVNNHIHHVSCRQRTGAGHIHIGGVGVRLAHNLIHDGPHQAIWLSGNDHVIEFNEIHHTGMETDDCGAFYLGRNPSERGSVVRHNFWHDIGSPRAHGSCAIYFDDGSGGQMVFGNVFYRAAGGNFGAVFSHGGHDNVVANNIFIDCPLAVGNAPWPDKLWKEWLAGELWQTKLRKEVDITQPPYVERYPALQGFLEYKSAPRINYASNNVVVNCPRLATGNWATNNNFITPSDPGFVNAKKMNFSLQKDSVVFRQIPGFKPIEFDSMGRLRD